MEGGGQPLAIGFEFVWKEIIYGRTIKVNLHKGTRSREHEPIVSVYEGSYKDSSIFVYGDRKIIRLSKEKSLLTDNTDQIDLVVDGPFTVVGHSIGQHRSVADLFEVFVPAKPSHYRAVKLYGGHTEVILIEEIYIENVALRIEFVLVRIVAHMGSDERESLLNFLH